MLDLKTHFSATVLVFIVSLGSAVDAAQPDNGGHSIRIGPQPIAQSESGIGRTIPDILLHNVFGGSFSLHESKGNRGTVVVVHDPDCPVSRRYRPRVAQLARTYRPQGFNFIIAYMNDRIGATALASDAAGFGGPASFAGRGAFRLGQALGVRSAGDVFVLNHRQQLVYRGAVDDQYGIGYTKAAPTRHLLRNALDDLIYGGEVREPATTAPGCYIDADPLRDLEIDMWEDRTA